MAFFNKKEEVIDVQLTPYGRYLLSIGKLDPSYYCFYDDDIIYDSTAMGVTEIQNETHGRIVNDTPKFKANCNSAGVETNLWEFAVSSSMIEDIRYEAKYGNINKFQQPIGTNYYDTEKSPAWDFKIYDCEISGSRKFLTGSMAEATKSNTPVMNIPQIDIEIDYEWEIVPPEYNPSNTSGITGTEPSINSQTFDDGTYFKITQKSPIIKLLEQGSFDTVDNFSIEVYKVEELKVSSEHIPLAPTGHAEKRFRRLKFPAPAPMIQNGILVDPEDVVVDTSFSENPDEVEYFFELIVDRNIPDADLCETVGKIEVENIFLDEELKCPDTLDSNVVPAIYQSRVLPEDLEDCD